MLKKHIHTKIYSQSYYTEGPAIDGSGNFFFTSLRGGTVFKMTNEGSCSEWTHSVCPNGQVILSNGQHIICDSMEAALIRFDANGNFIRKDIDRYCGGQPISVPNDIITDSKGNIYFTDSVRHQGKIGFISGAGEQKIIAKELDYPNGLALSGNEKTLFIAESYQNRILAFEVNSAGGIAGRKVFCNLPQHPSNTPVKNLPDGIKIDEEDHLWVAHYGMGYIYRISPDGNLCQSIKLPFDLPSNLFVNSNTIMVTGGYAEPGPGCIAKISLSNE